MALTDSWLRSTNGKPQEKMMTKSDRDGLSVRVTPKGKIIFQFRYRWDGKGQRIDIGSYPATSLKDARESALIYKGELEQNRNPRVVKAIKKSDAITAHTVRSIISLWYEKFLKSAQIKADEIHRSFELHVYPKIGDLPHDEVNLQTWLSLLEDITEKTPSTAVVILNNAKKAHFWGYSRGIIKNRPLEGMTSSSLGVKQSIGERTLTDEELILLFKFIDQKNYNPRNEILIKLCLLFGNRVGELLKAKKTDFDLENNIWTVPPENHKRGRRSGRPLIRAIIPAAKELIERAMDISRGEYLFTISTGRKMKDGGHGRIVEVMNVRMSKCIDNYKTWSIHDLRRTMRTGISELTDPHIAEIMVGHKLPGVWQTYDKFTYLKQQHEAYEKWWDKVLRIAYHSPNQ
ncbi:site-specific integrase [Providencia rettgeri]|uniref:tyrosine-type recombinase/integrase n=3 Tax=Providencia rettgeri TaxID=587 RepID=UPI0032DA14AA